jgi:H+/Cl- antiporter ClcA
MGLHNHGGRAVKRWVIHIAVGIVFGIFDYFYLELLYRFPAEQVFGNSRAGEMLRFVIMFLLLIWASG